jgi:uncharacterized metal-binding protein
METGWKRAGNGSSGLMFCCSGAADTAEIADRAVRTLHRAGEVKMFCLAGVAGGVEQIVTNTQAAERRIVVDGCEADCARKTMERNGFTEFLHLRVTDLGWEKGKTPVTEERIGQAAGRLREMLAAEAGEAG